MIAASPSFVSVLWAGYPSRAAAMQALQGHSILRAGICWNDSTSRSCCWTPWCCLQTTTFDGLSLEAVIDHLQTLLCHFSLLTDTILSLFSEKKKNTNPHIHLERQMPILMFQTADTKLKKSSGRCKKDHLQHTGRSLLSYFKATTSTH